MRGVGVATLGVLVARTIVTVCSSEVVDAEVDSLEIFAVQRSYNTVRMAIGEYL